jgi:hypothetical protein
MFAMNAIRTAWRVWSQTWDLFALLALILLLVFVR